MINSLSLAVWDTDKRRGQSLKERVEMFNEREAALYIGNRDDFTRHDVFFVSFNETGEPVIKVARKVRLSGEDVFLMLIGERGSDLVPFFRPKIRPNGVMFHPVKNTELRDVFSEIISEMQRLEKKKDTSAFVLKSEGVSYRIPYNDILFFEASIKKVNLHTSGQQIGYYDSIEKLTGTLPENFIRCHRSYIVNIHKVEEMRGVDMELCLDGGFRIPLSRSYKNDVKKALADAGAKKPVKLPVSG